MINTVNIKTTQRVVLEEVCQFFLELLTFYSSNYGRWEQFAHQISVDLGLVYCAAVWRKGYWAEQWMTLQFVQENAVKDLTQSVCYYKRSDHEQSWTKLLTKLSTKASLCENANNRVLPVSSRKTRLLALVQKTMNSLAMYTMFLLYVMKRSLNVNYTV